MKLKRVILNGTVRADKIKMMVKAVESDQSINTVSFDVFITFLALYVKIMVRSFHDRIFPHPRYHTIDCKVQ